MPIWPLTLFLFLFHLYSRLNNRNKPTEANLATMDNRSLNRYVQRASTFQTLHATDCSSFLQS